MFKEYRIKNASNGETIGFYGINASINKIIKEYEAMGWKMADVCGYPIEPIQAKGEYIYIYMA